MRTGSVCFLLGILILVGGGDLPPSGLVWMLVPVALLSIRFRYTRWLAWLLAGLLWCWYVSISILETGLAPDLEGRDVTISGYVTGIPGRYDRYQRFEFYVDTLQDARGITRRNPGHIRLNWYHPYPYLESGSRLTLRARLRQPHGFSNPGGVDTEAMLFQQRIRATGYVRSAIAVQPPRPSLFNIDRQRENLGRYLQSVLDGFPNAAILVPALLVGDRSAMNPSQRETLARTGTSHLLAISGMHIGLMSALVYLLVRWCWVLWPTASRRVPANWPASIMALLAAVGYALLAGLTLPTRRALVMVMVVILCRLHGRHVRATDVLGLALLVVLLLDPLAVLSAGFWLSFAATAILLSSVDRPETRTLWPQTWLLQWRIGAGLLPFSLPWFQLLPIIGLPVNLVAIPLIGMAVMPLMFIGMMLQLVNYDPGQILILMAGRIVELLWKMLEFASQLPLAALTVGRPELPALMFSLCGAFLLLSPRGLLTRLPALLLFVPLLFPARSIPQTGEFDLMVLDVGQGLAAVIHTRRHVLLFDTGPGQTDGFNAGRAVILPYLASAGVRRLDGVVVSHGDNDHIGGLHSVLERIPVDRIYSSVPGQINHSGAGYCRDGISWVWDEVPFSLLHPAADDGLEGNDASCVLRVGTGRSAVLLAGDIESRAEARLLARQGDALSAAVLLAPHHGSKTSSTAAFIRAVAPDTVILSTGYLNRFRLPNQAIISRYEQAGARPLNTATQGAISIQFRNEGQYVTTRRGLRTAYWNHQPDSAGMTGE